jgi:hypothetical protein
MILSFWLPAWLVKNNRLAEREMVESCDVAHDAPTAGERA